MSTVFAWLFELAIGWKFPRWLARAFSIAVPVLLVIGLVLVGWLLFASHYENKGAERVEKKVAAANKAAVADARSDERKAQATSSQVGVAVGRANDTTTAVVTAKRAEIRNAIESTPRDVPGRAPVPVDSGELSASLDALVDRANRAANASDARP